MLCLLILCLHTSNLRKRGGGGEKRDRKSGRREEEVVMNKRMTGRNQEERMKKDEGDMVVLIANTGSTRPAKLMIKGSFGVQDSSSCAFLKA